MENSLLQLFAGQIEIAKIAQTWLVVMLTVVVVCFLVSEITKNYSQVDKLWSLMPIVYAGITLAAFPTSLRLWLMTILVAFWGIRLSYNFSRKGGYNIVPWKGEEDYRWNIMRKQPALKGRLRFGLFNILFISFYQQLLILLFSTPLLIAAQYNNSPLNIYDAIPAVLMFTFIVIETIADKQLFDFQQQKQNRKPREARLEDSFKKGFLSQGFFSKVRHPNFAAEQAIWVCFYFFGVTASGQWFNWTSTGVILLIMLFQGSSVLTENISSKKYPDYTLYQKYVPRFVPNPFRKRI